MPETVAGGADLRVTILTLGEGECVPWHPPSEIADDVVCMEGPMPRDAGAARRSRPSAGAAVRGAGQDRAHAHGVDGRPWRVPPVQGVGVYDFIAVD